MKSATDLSGKHIGKLVVISRASNVGRRVRWNCKCSCGNTKTMWACNLLTKASQSCGCSLHKYGKQNQNWKGYGDLGMRQFWEIKDGASRRKHLFDISIVYLWNLFRKQNGKCSLSGVNLVLNSQKDGKMLGTASLDRIDNTKGYVKGNVQWVHKDVNFMKQDLSQREFVEYCRLIVKNHENL